MLKKKALENRKNIINMVAAAGSGHPGGSLSAIDILTYLYENEIKLTKDNAQTRNRDKLVLSKGHAAPALYAALAMRKIIDEEELESLRKMGSRLQGHPNMNDLPGVDMSTGSLGQGISTAVGMALANKVLNSPYRIYSVLGDGEIQEGQVWEAFMFAAANQLNNLTVFIDNNGLQIDGRTDERVKNDSLADKLKAFGWKTLVIDGHDFDQIQKAVEAAKTSDLPTAIIARTVKGKGVPFMENQVGWHGKAPNEQQKEEALKALGGE